MNQEQLLHKKLEEPYPVKASEYNSVRDVDLTKRTVTGISNMFFYFDSDADVLIPGSTLKSINERGPGTNVPGKIKHALFHDLEKLPAKNLVLEERSIDLQGRKVFCQYFESKMLATEDGNDTLIKYQEEVYDQHSIGFRYLDLEFVDKESEGWNRWLDQLINPEDAAANGYMFIVKEIKQYEFSTVAFGANRLTPYLGVKGANSAANTIKLLGKLDRLQEVIKSPARISEEALYNISLEILQVKQLIVEQLNQEPSSKDTLLGRHNQDTPQEFDLSKAIKETAFFKF